MDAPDVLSEDELRRLLAQATGTKNGLRNRCILELMGRRGLRVSEVLKVRMHDVKWGEQKIIIRESKAGRKRKDGTKTKGRAVVDIPDGTWALIEQWKKERRPYAKGSEFLFVTTERGKEGRPMTRQYVWGMVHRYARRAKIEGPCHPHTLRHTFATSLLRRRLPLPIIQRAMRHASIQNTQIYLHVEDAEVQDAVRDL